MASPIPTGKHPFHDFVEPVPLPPPTPPKGVQMDAVVIGMVLFVVSALFALPMFLGEFWPVLFCAAPIALVAFAFVLTGLIVPDKFSWTYKRQLREWQANQQAVERRRAYMMAQAMLAEQQRTQQQPTGPG